MQYHSIAKELIWFFNHSAASIKFSSSYGTLIQQAFGLSYHSSNYEPDVNVSKGARHLSHCYQKLSKLPIQYQRCLSATYNFEYRFPVDIISIFGVKTGSVLIISPIPLNELTSLCRKIRKKKMTPEEEKLIFKLRNESNDLYEKAHLEYLK